MAAKWTSKPLPCYTCLENYDLSKTSFVEKLYNTTDAYLCRCKQSTDCNPTSNKIKGCVSSSTASRAIPLLCATGCLRMSTLIDFSDIPPCRLQVFHSLLCLRIS